MKQQRHVQRCLRSATCPALHSNWVTMQLVVADVGLLLTARCLTGKGLVIMQMAWKSDPTMLLAQAVLQASGFGWIGQPEVSCSCVWCHALCALHYMKAETTTLCVSAQATCM